MDEVWFWGDTLMEHCQMYGISDKSINVLNDQAKKSLVSLWSGMNAIGTFPPAAALRIFHISIVPGISVAAPIHGRLLGKNSHSFPL